MTSPDTGVLPRGETRLEVSREDRRGARGRRRSGPRLRQWRTCRGDPGQCRLRSTCGRMRSRSATTPGRMPVSTTVTTHRVPAVRSFRNEPLLERLSHGRDWGWFRYPYLGEGNDPAQRSAVREYLAPRSGYRIAAVTVDFSDFAYNGPYTRCEAKGDDKGDRRIGERVPRGRARRRSSPLREMARALYGADMPQVLLTHVGRLRRPHVTPAASGQYREMGFRFVTLGGGAEPPALRGGRRSQLFPRPGRASSPRCAARACTPPPRRTPTPGSGRGLHATPGPQTQIRPAHRRMRGPDLFGRRGQRRLRDALRLVVDPEGPPAFSLSACSLLWCTQKREVEATGQGDADVRLGPAPITTIGGIQCGAFDDLGAHGRPRFLTS